PLPDLVTDPPEDREPLRLAAGRRRWIVEGPMDPRAGSREVRAGLAPVVARRDGIVERLARERRHGLAVLAPDVDAELSHRLDRERPHLGGLRPRAVGLEAVAAEGAQQALGHLRAGTVVGAQ